MFGQYGQNRSRLVLVAAIGSGLFWSGVGLPPAAQAQQADPVDQLIVSYVSAGFVYGSGWNRQGKATVDIVDGNGNPVNGALVVGNWSGCFKLNGASDTTETVCTTDSDGNTICNDGRAVIWGKNFSCRKNCLVTFTVTDVRKDGMTYVPEAGPTSNSVWCNVLSASVQRGAKAAYVSSRPVVSRIQPMPTRRLARWWRR